MGSQKQQCPHVPVPTTDYSVVITTLFHKPIPISAFIVNSTSQRQTDRQTNILDMLTPGKILTTTSVLVPITKGVTKYTFAMMTSILTQTHKVKTLFPSW